jgi:ketosteroid isomerase-like protein
MGAPSPELVDLWLARAFNAHDVDAAASMYHPEANVVRLEQVHDSTVVARGAEGIRETMAGYIGLKPHMDVIVHHTTITGEVALCRSQWRITGTDQHGEPVEVHHHGMSCAGCRTVSGSSSSITRGARTPPGLWTSRPRPRDVGRGARAGSDRLGPGDGSTWIWDGSAPPTGGGWATPMVERSTRAGIPFRC